MNCQEYEEEHGFRRGHCQIHGWFYTDGGGCEQCAEAEEERLHEPGEEIQTLRTSTTQTARKTYNLGSCGEIRPGDEYRRTVTAGYYVGGARWLIVNRARIAKGPAWAGHLAD